MNNTVNTTVTLTITDAAGNSSTDSIVVTTEHTDNTAPTISSFSASDTSISLNSSANSTQTVTFSASVSDNVGVNSVSISPLLTLSSVIGGNYVWSKLYDANQFSFGTVTENFTITVRDSEGNTTTDSETVSITKTDSTGPSISSFTSSSTSIIVTTSNQTKTINLTVVVADNVAVKTITVSGATPLTTGGGGGGGGGGIEDPPPGDEIIIDENKIVNNIIQLESNDTTPGTSNTFYFVKTYLYNDFGFGSNTDNITATVTDFQGNSSNANLSITITKIDNQSPTISSFTADDLLINLTSEGANTTQTVTFTAVITDNRIINDVVLPNTNFVGFSGNTYTYNKTFDTSNYNFGNTTEIFTVSATDNTGNSSTSSLTVTIVKDDNTGPVISAFLPDFNEVTVGSLSKTEMLFLL